MRRRFFTLDVFTRQLFAGNPLAVILDSEGLTDQVMQNVAREFNLSETVFVFAPADQTCRADLRIFTPAAELPFAGHPTVGAAVLLAILGREGKAGEDAFSLGEKIGQVACKARVVSGNEGEATFRLPRLPQFVEAAPANATMAHALGLQMADIGAADLQPEIWSAGVPFALVPVRDRAALDLAYPDMRHWQEAFGGKAGGHVYVFATEVAEAGHDYAARMFAPTLGVMEDPATGSAVAALSGYLTRHVYARENRRRLVIEQGYKMGRPSQIALDLKISDGALQEASISGSAIVVSDGTITL